MYLYRYGAYNIMDSSTRKVTLLYRFSFKKVPKFH